MRSVSLRAQRVTKKRGLAISCPRGGIYCQRALAVERAPISYPGGAPLWRTAIYAHFFVCFPAPKGAVCARPFGERIRQRSASLPLRGPFGHILRDTKNIGNICPKPLQLLCSLPLAPKGQRHILLLPRRGVPQRVAPLGHEEQLAKPIDNDVPSGAIYCTNNVTRS